MTYITLLDGATVVKVLALAFVTMIIMGIIHTTYTIEDMGEDDQ